MVFRSVFNSIISILAFLSMISCIILDEEDKEKYLVSIEGYQYDLISPSRKYTLPGPLSEVSGLSYWKDNIFLCIEDETGNLYLFDRNVEEVVNRIKFGKKGDYEGVACHDDRAYVIKSGGNLYHFDIKNEPDATKVELPFSVKNDLEGIVKSPVENEFYIVCKRSPDTFGRDLKGRAVYKYNFGNDQVDPEPFVLLTSDMFEQALIDLGLKPSNHMPFMPSGIAIHPETEDVFLISSVGRLLVVLNKSGEIITMAPLNRSLLRQPEGITFDTDGTLYIASEGRGIKGYILEFENQLNIQ